MKDQELIERLRMIKDYPQEGILFCDITTLLKEGDALKATSDKLTELYREKGVTKVVGIESRGFALGTALAVSIGAGFVMARKPGKLPADTLEESYEKEYGKDTIQIHKDAITENDVVLIHDDILATGGTMIAAYNLVKRFSPKQIYINFIIELDALEGRKNLPTDEVTALLHI